MLSVRTSRNFDIQLVVWDNRDCFLKCHYLNDLVTDIQYLLEGRNRLLRYHFGTLQLMKGWEILNIFITRNLYKIVSKRYLRLSSSSSDGDANHYSIKDRYYILPAALNRNQTQRTRDLAEYTYLFQKVDYPRYDDLDRQYKQITALIQL